MFEWPKRHNQLVALALDYKIDTDEDDIACKTKAKWPIDGGREQFLLVAALLQTCYFQSAKNSILIRVPGLQPLSSSSFKSSAVWKRVS
jgi:hypothetical protein